MFFRSGKQRQDWKSLGQVGGKPFMSRRGIRVPLPVLFFLLMTLVIVSVFDILSQSRDVHVEANKRVAKSILNSTLKQAYTDLNGYAVQLALLGGDVAIDEVILRATSGNSARLSQKALILYLDSGWRVVRGYVGSDPLPGTDLARLVEDMSQYRTAGADGAGTALSHVVTVGRTQYVISDPVPLRAGHRDGDTGVLIGLPMEDLLMEELSKYEIFTQGSLREYIEQGRMDGFKSVVNLVVDLQREDYKEFHLSAVSQVLTVLVAFVICVMIGHHIDEKSDALEESLDTIAEREQEAQRLRHVAERASDAKSRFIANMSHEMRTPLNAIMGYSEIIASEIFGRFSPQQDRYRQYAENIHAAGSRLLNEISHVLDFSDLEYGNIQPDSVPVDLDQTFRQALDRLAAMAGDRDITVDITVPDGCPKLLADPVMLAKMLEHLLSNAIKFSEPRGSVRLTAELTRHGEVRLTVADDGKGMEIDRLDELAQPFVQNDDVYARRNQGVGLGLTLVKAYADLHGALVSVASSPDRGTCVSIRFPPQLTVSDDNGLAKTG